MSFLNSLVAWYFKNKITALQESLNNAVDIQNHTLLELLYSAQFTEFGQKHNFSSIGSYEDFKKHVPIQSYEDVKAEIAKCMNGEQNLFWPTKINSFAKSSGTTNDKSKFIPVSPEALDRCHYQGGRDVLAFYVNSHPNTKIFSGKGVFIGGSNTSNPINSETTMGDLSALMIKQLPVWVHLFKTPSAEISLMADWTEKVQKMAEYTAHENVTNISGVPTWTTVLFDKLLEITGKKNIHEVWPNLELFIHGGVNFTPYKEQFKKYLPNQNMNYLETYNASEGFFGIQTNSNDSALSLMVNYGIFYEFIAMEDFSLGNMHTIPLWEVKPNVNYAVIITTNSGLWRYELGDTVTFSQIHPFKFHITGRTKLFINAFGEELMIDNAEKGIEFACHETGANIRDYTAAPIYLDDPQNAGHEWLIEFAKEPDDLGKFTFLLDQKLKELNSDYEAKRQGDLVLNIPKIKILPLGSFEKWLGAKGKLGGQHKVPRLWNNRDIVEEIMQSISISTLK